MNEQTIEMQIHTKAQQAIADMNKILSSLNLTKNGIDKVTTTIDKNGNKTTKVLSSIQKEGQGLYKIIQKIDKDGSLKTVSTSMNNLKSSTDKAVNSASKLTNILSLGGAYLGAKKVTKQILSGLKASMDYSEALNLFNVVFENIDKDGKTVFSSVGKEAIQFQNQLNEAFGTNKQQTLTYHALYQSMAENMGIVSDKAGIMSKNTVKLINDLSSLYNKPEESVSTALSSGIYAGQVRPLRTYGIDITEKSLQPVLESLGIDRTVRELSQAEKQILRYIAVVRQSSVAHADWASTIESPSNQLKILGNQAKEATVYVSSLFIGTFSKILPYANAFLMVVKEISKAIATMFGIELKDYNTGIASSENAFVDLGDSVDNAIGKVKELKRQTLGFDEIHNINENKDTGSGTTGVSGGIDQRLLDAIKGYDNGMESVRMKALDIRNKIMEWLGFTIHTNEETNETWFTYDGIGKTLSNLKNWWQQLNTEGKIWTGFGMTIGFLKLFGAMKKISSLTGIPKLFGSISSSYKTIKSFGILDFLKRHNVSLNKGTGLMAMIVLGWSSFVKQYKNNLDFRNSVNEIGRAFSNLKNLIEPLEPLVEASFGRIGRLANSGLSIIDSGVNNFVNGISYPFKMFNDLINLDFKGALEDTGSTISTWGNNAKNIFIDVFNVNPFIHIKTEAEKAQEALKNLENALLNNGGVSINEYGESLENLLLNMTNNISNVDKYNQTIADSKKNYEDAKESLEILLTQMQTDSYKVTSEDIEKLNSILQKMVDNVRNSGQAFTDATTVIVNHLKEEGKISEEEALKVVKSAQLKAKAENDSAEQYRLKMLELTNQLESGKITQEQFTQKQIDLAKEFDKSISIVDSTKNSIKNYADYINGNDLISTKNFSELNDAINKIGTSFDENTEKLSTNYEGQKKILEELQVYYQQEISKQNETLDNLKRTKGEESQEYQNAKKVLEDYTSNYESVTKSVQGLNKQQSDDTKSMKQVVVESLLGIVSTLRQSGYDMETDSQGTVAKINSILQNMGLNVDLKGNMREVVNKINGQLGTDIPYTVKLTNKELKLIGVGVHPSVTVTANTNPASKAVAELIEKIKNSNAKFNITGSIVGGLRANGGIYSNGSWKDIPQYANGGIPSHGSMFVAGERGAEIVGHINGKTEVLNQSQIASAIYSAVVSAMSQFNGGGIAEINVHADKGIIVETAVNGIKQHINQTGELPFALPIK